MITTFYREPIYTVREGDEMESADLGPLKARIWRIRIPIRLALWWYQLRYKK